MIDIFVDHLSVIKGDLIVLFSPFLARSKTIQMRDSNRNCLELKMSPV